MNEVKATNKNYVISLTKKYGFNFKKDLGQNYLIDENIANKIVDSLNLTGDETVIEIGPGMGSLTQIICEKAKKVIAVEIDKKAVMMLEENISCYDNIEIINKDFLKLELREILKEEIEKGRDIKFISNLPYYITSPIIMKILEGKIYFSEIILMLQKEVGERLNAKAGSKDYSSFTLAVKYYCDVEILFSVSKNVFFPSPNVDSMVISLRKRKENIVNVDDEEFYFKVVRAAFSARRKMAFNSLVNILKLDKDFVKEAIRKSGIDEKARAENITIEQFALLSNNLIIKEKE